MAAKHHCVEEMSFAVYVSVWNDVHCADVQCAYSTEQMEQRAIESEREMQKTCDVDRCTGIYIYIATASQQLNHRCVKSEIKRIRDFSFCC